MTISEAQTTVDHWIKTIGVRYFNELTNTVLLMEEVGEMSRLMARIYGEQSFKKTENAGSAQAELADAASEIVFQDVFNAFLTPQCRLVIAFQTRFSDVIA